MKTKDRRFDSMDQASAAMKIPKETLQRIKAKGCPAFRGSRIYEQELRDYMDANAEQFKTSGDDTESIKNRKAFEDWRKVKLANDKEEGKLIVRKLVSMRLHELSAGQLTLLRQRLENELPAQVAGLDPASARIIFKRVVDEICGKMQVLVKDWD
jgi:hypothetical protein